MLIVKKANITFRAFTSYFYIYNIRKAIQDNLKRILLVIILIILVKNCKPLDKIA
jgi:hypothetical protein